MNAIVMIYAQTGEGIKVKKIEIGFFVIDLNQRNKQI